MIFIGDSHVGCFKKQKTLGIGAATAYGLLNINSKTKSRTSIEKFLALYPKEVVLINFGEVDCRHHVVHQAELQAKSIKEIVKGVVKRYFVFIDIIIEKGHNVIVWCPIPNRDETPSERALKKHGKYPMRGTYKERLEATIHFTNFCIEECKKRGLRWISFYEEMVNHPEWYKDMVHLNDKALPALWEKIHKAEQ